MQKAQPRKVWGLRQEWEGRIQRLARNLMETWAPAESLPAKYEVSVGGQVANKSLLEIMLEPARFERFYLAFTDSSYDPVDNYEFLESIGDKAWGVAVGAYCDEKLPRRGLTPGKISNIFSTFAAKTYQSEVAIKLGFAQKGIIRIGSAFPGDKRTWEDLYEDVMEAWIGATFLVCNSIVDGLGYIVCKELATTILDQEKISLETDYRDPANKLKDRFDAVKWTFSPKTYIDIAPGRGEMGGTVSLRLPPEASEMLQRLPSRDEQPGSEWDRVTRLRSSLLAGELARLVNASGGKNKLKREIQQEALDILDKLGFDEKWFVEMNRLFHGFRKQSWFSEYAEFYDSIVKTYGLKYTYFRLSADQPITSGPRSYRVEHATGLVLDPKDGNYPGGVILDVSPDLTEDQFRNPASYQKDMIGKFVGVTDMSERLREARQGTTAVRPSAAGIGGFRGRGAPSFRGSGAPPRGRGAPSFRGSGAPPRGRGAPSFRGSGAPPRGRGAPSFRGSGAPPRGRGAPSFRGSGAPHSDRGAPLPQSGRGVVPPAKLNIKKTLREPLAK